MWDWCCETVCCCWCEDAGAVWGLADCLKHVGIRAVIEGIAFSRLIWNGSGAGLAMTPAIIGLETARKAARPHGLLEGQLGSDLALQWGDANVTQAGPSASMQNPAELDSARCCLLHKPEQCTGEFLG